ncbi:MAG: GDP-mannose 4,6-dehydratase [Vicinamibacterales bacterium]|nr:GDP-mannose 4,6-dehydratase [Vicinamibacterales bacterium]
MASVLVTGAAGFAGSHLADLVAQSGTRVTGWRRPGTQIPRGATTITWQLVDSLDRKAVARAIADARPDVVYHCAGSAHVGQSWTNACEPLAANVLGTHHLLEGLRVAGIGARVLIPGSSLIYRQSDRALTEQDATGPASPYGLSKMAQELLGRRAFDDDRQQIFLTRSFNHTGPRQKPSYAAPGFARQIASIEAGRMAPTIEVGNLDAARDLTDVRDVVRAYRDIVEKGRPGVVYNVCSGTAIVIRDLLDRLVAMSRVPVHVRVDPGRFRPSDNPMVLGDRSRLESDTGWTPAIPLDKTLADLLDYWRKEVE